ncbi:MAG: hypothetical protein IPM79_14725 [Polyangiaceae bacterium]|jgi:hypothetical protein|nr:hypothetical protein [Polyangiaceae bacterium]MBK8938837.1 hypothetical protein [Polyangiaceae bacterium]
MTRRTGLWLAGGVMALLLVGFGTLRHLRGPQGTSTAYGGDVEAIVLADFPSLDPSRWAVAAPVSLEASRGAPVLIEGWAPG